MVCIGTTGYSKHIIGSNSWNVSFLKFCLKLKLSNFEQNMCEAQGETVYKEKEKLFNKANSAKAARTKCYTTSTHSARILPSFPKKKFHHYYDVHSNRL